MQKFYIQIAAVLMLIGCAITLDCQEVEQLRPFTSAAGHFSVSFPGIPESESDTVDLKDGGKAAIAQFYVADDEMDSYTVMYSDYDSGYIKVSPEVFLEKARDDASAGRTITGDTAIQLNGIPGRAFKVYDKNGQMRYTVRMFLVGNRLYQVVVGINIDHEAPQLDDFLNSFQINKGK